MKYVFVGDGQGVPGLPHEVDDRQVKALGDTGYHDVNGKPVTYAAILAECIKAGLYKEAKKPKEVKADG